MDEEMIDCMTEAELDAIEITLRRRMEDLLSQGEIEKAERIEDKIESLDHVDLCTESGRELFDDLRKVGFYDVSEKDYIPRTPGQKYRDWKVS